MASQANEQSIASTEPITHKPTKEWARDIEEVGKGSPTKIFPHWRRTSENDIEPRRRIDAERIGGEVVNEPDERYHALLEILVQFSESE